MKSTLLLSLLFAGVSFAGFETWTSSEGKTAELELVKVTSVSGENVGEFRTKDGKTVTRPASQLSKTDAARLAEWKPAAEKTAAAVPGPSAFDKLLDGNLVKLSGKSLKKFDLAEKPSKYYLFYYTASWCGPCQQFTPSLVEFYNRNKPEHPEFEIILVTSDSDEDAMEKYAVGKQMTWPHLRMNKTEKFKKEVKHPGTGIPNLVLTDLQGNIIKASYEGTEYKGPQVVMNHLESLLK